MVCQLWLERSSCSLSAVEPARNLIKASGVTVVRLPARSPNLNRSGKVQRALRIVLKSEISFWMEGLTLFAAVG